MEALIPKLFILTAEASIVFFLIIVAIFIFNNRAKRKDIKAVNELVSHYTGTKEERLTSLKNHLKSIAFKGNMDEQAEKLYTHEKSLIKEFVTLYLRRDTYRLIDYPDTIIESDNLFLKTSGAGLAATVSAAPETAVSEEADSEQTANATMLAREQAESNDAHLKELSELRLKNTELNEHLFEALETITALMTEHGKKTGQEVASNAQKILEAIIYLRDQRLNSDNDPSTLAPSADDTHDEIESFQLEDDFDTVDNPFSVDLAENDATLDDATAINLGINDELNIDLDTLKDEVPATESSQEEADPWADALAEQADSEAAQDSQEADPWADALAEQATAEAETDKAAEAEVDPWAEALAEQEKSEKK